MAAQSLSRMDPANIADTLLRVELYREIRQAQDESLAGWTTYEIQPADRLMPELIAYKVYSLDMLKWVVVMAAGLDDMREPLDVGAFLKLPPVTWIRERIRHYMDMERQ
jgi:hypothetical protein